MDPTQIFEWLKEQQALQQQHQVQLLQQLAAQGQEQQRQIVREMPQQQEIWLQQGVGQGIEAGPVGDREEGPGGAAQLPIRLTKMGPLDDPEVYLWDPLPARDLPDPSRQPPPGPIAALLGPPPPAPPPCLHD
nr:protein enabled homolog isoform X1 [Pelodiscus sinensis]|eukprot:XP_014435980.1 protein enabled homolog isoform X1 [Pelodiscus sinensis]